MRKNGKILRVGLVLSAASAVMIYILFITFLSRFTGLNSDKANHILQAQDILRGNFFFKDWNLTGVTFFTTDLLFYELAVIIAGGIGYRAAYVAYGLMTSSCLLLSFCASLNGAKKHRLQKAVLFLLLFAIPCYEFLVNFRTHSGAICWTLVAIMSAAAVNSSDEDIRSKKNLLRLAVCLCALTLGMVGDMLTAIEGIAPILLYCAVAILTSSETYNLKKDKKTYLILTSALSAALALLIDKLYFAIGGANRNSYIGDRHFSTIDELHGKVWTFMEDLLSLGDADFFSGRLGDVSNYIRIINAVVILIAVAIIFKNLWRLLRGQKTDALSGMLSISFVMIACAFLFTDMVIDRAGMRYMTIAPLVCYIVLIRDYDNVLSFMRNKKIWAAAIYAVAFISFAGKIKAIASYRYPESVKNWRETAAFLTEHNLYNGYASFWNASIFTVLSGGEVNVRHIINSGGKFAMYNWFCKDQWYRENTNFILLQNNGGGGGIFGVTEDAVIAYFGPPAEIYSVNDYGILVYNHSLSPYLAATSIIGGEVIKPFEMPHNEFVKEKGDGFDKTFVMERGGIVYGPYAKIAPGEYRLAFEGGNLEYAECDVYSGTKNDVAYEIASRSENRIVVNFTIRQTGTNDIEFRLFNNTEESVEFYGIAVERIK